MIFYSIFQKLEESVKITDRNFDKLKKESDRLEKHTQTCSWWIWIMLVIVTLTFLAMIMFMKLFSKKNWLIYNANPFIQTVEMVLKNKVQYTFCANNLITLVGKMGSSTDVINLCVIKYYLRYNHDKDEIYWQAIR